MAKDKIRIRFDAAPPAVLKIDAKTSLEPGQDALLDEDTARSLLEWAEVSIVEGTLEPRWPSTHADLDALAEKLSLRWPDPAEGKTTLTVTEKHTALQEAGFTPESALAATADGDHNNEGDEQ